IFGDQDPYVTGIDVGRVESILYPAIVGRHQGHLRDHFLMVINASGEHSMMVSGQAALSGVLDTVDSLVRRLDLRYGFPLINFEGGNILGDGSRNFTLGETIAENYRDQGQVGIERVEHILGKRGDKLVVLDDEQW